MLDKKMLEDMPPETIFATGETQDNRLARDIPLRWVAVRGRIYDWTIYYHHLDRGIGTVASEGDKCITEKAIRELVSCDDEAFALYRY